MCLLLLFFRFSAVSARATAYRRGFQAAFGNFMPPFLLACGPYFLTIAINTGEGSVHVKQWYIEKLGVVYHGLRINGYCPLWHGKLVRINHIFLCSFVTHTAFLYLELAWYVADPANDCYVRSSIARMASGVLRMDGFVVVLGVDLRCTSVTILAMA
jgi:hypothetical protein